VSVLEWILILEALTITLMGVMGLISMIIARQDPNDPVAVFCRTFWRETLWPPEVMSTDSATLPPLGPGSRRKAKAKAAAPEEDEGTSDDDAFYGRFKKDDKGRVTKVDLTVLVQSHAAADEVLGRDGEGLKVQVIGEAGESRSNKALIEMVANAVGVKSFQLTLTKGHYQPVKTVQIQGMSPEELQNKLSTLAEVE
jgi:uncharacterized protein YggU (UPF0235/DUF167 family)